MSIFVYADESGTHDLSAREPGSKVAVLAGYCGFAEDWVNFCGRWQTTLNEYKVSEFHFSVFADKINSSTDPNWPYFGWSEDKRREFLFRLASIAGSRARFPFASSFQLADFNTNSDIKSKLRNLGLADEQINGPHLVYLGLFADFFEAFLAELKLHHPSYSNSVSFIFDHKCKDDYWNNAAHEMFRHYAKDDSRLISVTFGTTWNFVPLQAADMIAYRLHQIWENEHRTKTVQSFKELDYLLWGNFNGEEDLRTHMRKLLSRQTK